MELHRPALGVHERHFPEVIAGYRKLGWTEYGPVSRGTAADIEEAFAAYSGRRLAAAVAALTVPAMPLGDPESETVVFIDWFWGMAHQRLRSVLTSGTVVDTEAAWTVRPPVPSVLEPVLFARLNSGEQRLSTSAGRRLRVLPSADPGELISAHRDHLAEHRGDPPIPLTALAQVCRLFDRGFGHAVRCGTHNAVAGLVAATLWLVIAVTALRSLGGSGVWAALPVFLGIPVAYTWGRYLPWGRPRLRVTATDLQPPEPTTPLPEYRCRSAADQPPDPAIAAVADRLLAGGFGSIGRIVRGTPDQWQAVAAGYLPEHRAEVVAELSRPTECFTAPDLTAFVTVIRGLVIVGTVFTDGTIAETWAPTEESDPPDPTESRVAGRTIWVRRPATAAELWHDHQSLVATLLNTRDPETRPSEHRSPAQVAGYVEQLLAHHAARCEGRVHPQAPLRLRLLPP